MPEARKAALKSRYKGYSRFQSRRNRKDLTIRLQQFFDYYMKGAPEPAWMKTGVPALKKDRYFGYEYAE